MLKSFIVCLFAGAVVTSLCHAASAKEKEQQTIYEGIYLDGVDVGGLTKEEAEEAYEKYIDGIGDLNLTFETSVGSYSTTLDEIGVFVSAKEAVEQAYNYGRQGNILNRYKDIKALEKEEVVLVADKEISTKKLKEKLEKETGEIVTSPKNATIARENGEFIIYDGESGQEIDAQATIEKVEEYFDKEWKQKDITLKPVIKEVEPEYTAEDFYQVDSVLGQFATEYNSGNTSRSQNLSTGASKVSGTVLMPGQQFSMYQTVSPFTEENGYANAGQYVNNELVDGLGGGICQVSTTLYNAVLMAELQVDERYPHSLTVSYVPLSRDAAIAGDYMDFKFTNNTEYPIYIEGYAGGGSISFAIYGHETRAENRTIYYETKTIETYEPGDPEEIQDDTLTEGTTVTEQSAHTGYYAELWKYIYVDGELTDSVKVNSSQYTATAAKIRVGTKKVVPATTEAPEQPATPEKPVTTEKPAATEAPKEQTTEAPVEAEPQEGE